MNKTKEFREEKFKEIVEPFLKRLAKLKEISLKVEQTLTSESMTPNKIPPSTFRELECFLNKTPERLETIGMKLRSSKCWNAWMD